MVRARGAKAAAEVEAAWLLPAADDEAEAWGGPNVAPAFGPWVASPARETMKPAAPVPLSSVASQRASRAEMSAGRG